MCTEFGIDLEIQENRVNVLVIETPNIFAHVIDMLINQMEGKEGSFILSEKDTIMTLGKTAEIIVNPFAIDCNEKRIQQKLYQELISEMKDSMMEQTVKLQGDMISYLEELLSRSPYFLEFDVEDNMAGLLKLCHVEIADQEDTLVGKIASYMKALKRFCSISTLFFVNLKSYVTQSEMEELYQCAFYEKINLILLENTQKEKLENETVCILDQDMCIIDVD
ncbi:MAG: type II-A CRISPR-associated protein Csn2 [Bacteroidales bacterium]|nr:type II-A CRISPR-associated protein Csn2 [Bacteroidales bacterium]MCM1422260.1 type II-A CRISPR-associated protein Csn2 [bacterium]